MKLIECCNWSANSLQPMSLKWLLSKSKWLELWHEHKSFAVVTLLSFVSIFSCIWHWVLTKFDISSILWRMGQFASLLYYKCKFCMLPWKDLFGFWPSMDCSEVCIRAIPDTSRSSRHMHTTDKQNAPCTSKELAHALICAHTALFTHACIVLTCCSFHPRGTIWLYCAAEYGC